MFALAYKLGNFLGQLVLPKPIRSWTQRTLREKLVKIGAEVVPHAENVVFQLVEVAVPRQVFAAIVKRSAGCGWRVLRGEASGDGQNGLRVVAVRSVCAGGSKFGG